MDTESLFTATEREILKLLEQRPRSSIELAATLDSSLANVSQRLRLLELAGLVSSRRVSDRDKGEPQVLYGLAGNLSYVIATTDRFVDKKAVQLSERNKVVLRIWFLEDPKLRYALEKAFLALEHDLQRIARLTYSGLEGTTPIIEAEASGRLPGEIVVGGDYGTVKIRVTSEPVGYLLYVKE